MRLEELGAGARVAGIVGEGGVEILAVTRYGDTAVSVAFRADDGTLGEAVLYRSDEARLRPVDEAGGFTFDADPAAFLRAAEAQRMHEAHLYDPYLAVHLSAIDPLPHQIRAVYGEMLSVERQPLRYLLADDPGAGKTIMAGLLLKELMLRGDVERCLIVAPGGLVVQWQDELAERFDIAMPILTTELREASRSGNPFLEQGLLIARMDHLARNDELREALESVRWDLVIVDEAHRMAAHVEGGDVRRTKRFELGELLRDRTNHLLLLTATPHAGKDEDFYLFLSLLDPDRFAEAWRNPERVEVGDLMRRMTKEELLTMDGTPLFPERRADTVPFELSDAEMELYEAVTRYVVEEMNRAERLSGDRRSVVGFGLQILQRRLASSPEAILRSLERRRQRLEARARELREQRARLEGLDAINLDPEDLEAFDEEGADPELVAGLEKIVDSASAAATLTELEAEVRTLARLVEMARRVRLLEDDRKWVELRGLLADSVFATPGLQGPRKLIVFTEHVDTLRYLAERLGNFLGRPDAVVTIHGGMSREERRAAEQRFTHVPECRILVATDAAGEGLNLQRANLVINYDLPWNPNRIEQRFGRVHRIGQREVCHLWNLVATNTREGMVYERLLGKLGEQRRALGGRVFDVLGRVLSGATLRELLVAAIREGESPEVMARLDQVIDAHVGEGLRELLAQESLLMAHLSLEDAREVAQQMTEAAARRLQPHYVERFFAEAFRSLGGQLLPRERGRFRIAYVPAHLRRRPSRRPVVERYERVCFDPTLARIETGPVAEVIAPGHPLMEAVVAAVLERDGPALARGTVLVDETGLLERPSVAGLVELTVVDGREQRTGRANVVSRRAASVVLADDGTLSEGSPVGFVDARPPRDDEVVPIDELRGVWPPASELERSLTGFALSSLGEEHLRWVRSIVEERVARTKRMVQMRLDRAITFWDQHATELREQEARGRTLRLNADNAAARAAQYLERKRVRLAALDQELALRAQVPRLLGAALVLPAASDPTALARARETRQAELRAVAAVLEAERRLGRNATAMPHSNPGYDIVSIAPDGSVRCIEVKGRIEGAEEVSLTTTEILTAMNLRERYVLALVRLGLDGHDEVRYLEDPFAGVAASFHDAEARRHLLWDPLWAAATEPR